MRFTPFYHVFNYVLKQRDISLLPGSLQAVQGMVRSQFLLLGNQGLGLFTSSWRHFHSCLLSQTCPGHTGGSSQSSSTLGNDSVCPHTHSSFSFVASFRALHLHPQNPLAWTASCFPLVVPAPPPESLLSPKTPNPAAHCDHLPVPPMSPVLWQEKSYEQRYSGLDWPWGWVIAWWLLGKEQPGSMLVLSYGHRSCDTPWFVSGSFFTLQGFLASGVFEGPCTLAGCHRPYFRTKSWGFMFQIFYLSGEYFSPCSLEKFCSLFQNADSGSVLGPQMLSSAWGLTQEGSCFPVLGLPSWANSLKPKPWLSKSSFFKLRG